MSKKSKAGSKSATVDSPPLAVKREAVFATQFREDMSYWTGEDSRVAIRAWKLVEEIMKTPFAGTGKPEPLKYGESNTWSRRLNQEHRIVYQVQHTKIDFLAARHHYK